MEFYSNDIKIEIYRYKLEMVELTSTVNEKELLERTAGLSREKKK